MKDWAEYYLQVTAATKESFKLLTDGKSAEVPLNDLLAAVNALRKSQGLA